MLQKSQSYLVVSFCLFAIFNQLIQRAEASNCYQTYPLIMNSADWDSRFTSMDMDQSQNIAAGGLLSSNNWNSQKVFFTYIERVTSAAKWTKQISSFEEVHTVTLNAGTNDKVAALIHKYDGSKQPYDWAIITLMVSDGTVG
ncbi:hypothetical protein FGO68_gene15205 [Halteria grandinella]|uniref:Uncharacterized protein n=1 Tax=Halteria grandinella TaxID=5974 RepID=A0A8J8TAD7_HALGN|nr:hypothetical protein FGO68_gene15205 [Halteria grandinella]